jgi:ATP-dependent protease ClpP protease subunit
MEDDLAFFGRLRDRSAELLAARSRLSVKQIKLRWKKRDWWLSAEEALDLGFIDQIREVPA